jgi:hypothetical protein
MASRKKSTRSASPDYDAARAIGESAQKIWLAGLGAFERARAEGPTRSSHAGAGWEGKRARLRTRP